MKFPNAHSGVKKIYIAQILSLVISVLFVISAILALASVKLESELGGDRCFGVLANMDFILICTYAGGGADPKLVLYKKR